MYNRKIMFRLFWTIIVFFSLLIMTLMTSCTSRSTKKVNVYNVDTLNTNYSIYIIDSCEYIVYYSGSSTWGTHKGNCKNPYHVH
jgi:hypothetical protein